MTDSLFKWNHFESDFILLCVRMDETYLKIRGVDHYLYRAVDSHGKTIDFWLSKHRDKASAKRFFSKALGACHVQHRMTKYLNNIVEQDHRFIKKIVKPRMSFHSYKSACATLSGIEVMHMIHKGQADTSNVISEITLINRLFGVA